MGSAGWRFETGSRCLRNFIFVSLSFSFFFFFEGHFFVHRSLARHAPPFFARNSQQEGKIEKKRTVSTRPCVKGRHFYVIFALFSIIIDGAAIQTLPRPQRSGIFRSILTRQYLQRSWGTFLRDHITTQILSGLYRKSKVSEKVRQSFFTE